MSLVHLTLLELIEGATPSDLVLMLPDAEERAGIEAAFAVDGWVKRKRRKLWIEARRALKRGHAERMRHELLARLAKKAERELYRAAA